MLYLSIFANPNSNIVQSSYLSILPFLPIPYTPRTMFCLVKFIETKTLIISSFFRKDVLLPPPLLCKDIAKDMLVDTVRCTMWCWILHFFYKAVLLQYCILKINFVSGTQSSLSRVSHITELYDSIVLLKDDLVQLTKSIFNYYKMHCFSNTA